MPGGTGYLTALRLWYIMNIMGHYQAEQPLTCSVAEDSNLAVSGNGWRAGAKEAARVWKAPIILT